MNELETLVMGDPCGLVRQERKFPSHDAGLMHRSHTPAWRPPKKTRARTRPLSGWWTVRLGDRIGITGRYVSSTVQVRETTGVRVAG